MVEILEYARHSRKCYICYMLYVENKKNATILENTRNF